MSALASAVRMERVRLLTLRSTWVVIGLALLVSLGVSVLIAVALRHEPIGPDQATVLLTSGGGFVPLPFAAVFLGVLGVLSVGHDYRHGLIHPMLTAVPSRTALMVGRLTWLAVTAAPVTVLCVGLAAGAGYAVDRSLPSPTHELLRALAGYVLLSVLWSWLGAAATWLLRSTAAVLALLFILPLVVEPLLRGVALLPQLMWLGPIVRWLPFAAGRVMMLTGASVGRTGVTITPAQGALVFGGSVLAILLLGWFRFVLRDA